MNVEELLGLHDELTYEAVAIMKAKNHDYTGDSGDPFANFRASEALGVKAELSILIRTLDKLQRLRTFVEKGELKVADEGVKDAVLDTINYMVLLYGLIQDNNQESK
jgi:hypothetical protein